MREVELKAVVDDLSAARKMLEQAGAKLSFEAIPGDRPVKDVLRLEGPD